MTLAEIFNSNPKYYELALELVEGMPKFRQEKMTTFLNEAQEQLNKNIQNETQGKWECVINNQNIAARHRIRLIIKRCNNNYPQAALAFSFDETEYKKAHFGIGIIESDESFYHIIELKNFYEKLEIENTEQIMENIINKKVFNTWWVAKEFYPRNTDFIKYILETKDACGVFVETIWEFFKKHKTLIEEINALIKKHHK